MSTDVAIPSSPGASLRSRFRTGIVFNFIGAVANQGSTFVFTIIAANLFGRRIFGQFAMLQTTILMVAQIAQLGCGVTATKYVAEFRSSDRNRVSGILRLLHRFALISGLVGAVATLYCARWLADSFLKAPELRVALELAAGVIFFTTVNGLLMGALAGLEAYPRLAKALTISGVIYLAVCTALAWRYGLNGGVAGFVISAAAQWVLLQQATSAECRQQGIPFGLGRWHVGTAGRDKTILSEFALPAALSGFTTLPALWLGNALLARRPNGYAELALYGAAYTLMTATLFLPNIANTVGTTLLNFHRSPAIAGKYRHTYWANLAIVLGITFGGAAGLAVLGPALLHLFGRSFTDGYPVLLILLGAAVVQGCGVAMYQVIQSEARMWLSFFAVSLPRDLLLVVLAYFLVPTYGARGLAGAYAMAWTAATLVIACIVLQTGLTPRTVAVGD